MGRLSAIVAVLGFCLGACGGDDAEDAAPKASASSTAHAAITPFPSIDFADVTSGVEYTTKLFQPAITLTLPAGEWELPGADSADHIELEPVTEDPVDDAGIGFHHMTQVFPYEGGEKPGDATEAPEDFALWLTEHPHLAASRPKPVEALGLKGVSIDVRTKGTSPKRYRDCGKVEGDCVVLYVGKIEPVVLGGNQKARYLILEQPDGKELVVEEWVDPASAFDDQVAVFDRMLKGATAAGG